MVIDTTGSVEQFFLESVELACKNQKVEASDATQTYLAGLLTDFVRPGGAMGETLERPLTLLLDDALQTPAPERFEKLKGLGDGTLYVAGFFGDHFEARGVDDDFVATIGGYAYRSAASMLLKGRGAAFDIYGELAEKFRIFTEVIAEVAEKTSFSPRTSAGALRMYEKWLRTGSDRLARELMAQGLSVRGGTA